MVRIPTHRPPTHPGKLLLEEFLIPLGLSQSQLAREIDVTFARVNELINGKRGITPDTALRLERFLGTTAQFWLNAQLACDLYEAKHSEDAKQIEKIRQFAHA